MINETEDVEPLFKFTYVSGDKVITEKMFTADTWMKAAQEFVNFLRGAGFILDRDALQLNEEYLTSGTWFEGVCGRDMAQLDPEAVKIVNKYIQSMSRPIETKE